jgi:hypothetical protein
VERTRRLEDQGGVTRQVPRGNRCHVLRDRHGAEGSFTNPLKDQSPKYRDCDEVKVGADSDPKPKSLGGADHYQHKKTRKASRRSRWHTSHYIALKQRQ